MVDYSKFIIHTMIVKHPAPSIAPIPPSSPDFAQMALDVLPSPTADAPGPSQHPIGQPDFSQGQPQTLSDLTVGPSSLPGQEPALVVQGNAKVYGTVTAANFDYMSDERLKKNISPMHDDALDALEQVGIFRYQLNNDPIDRQHIGVLAQNLQKCLPDAVELDAATGLWSVKLDRLVVYTLKGVQEASTALKALDTRQRLGMAMLMQQQATQATSAQADSSDAATGHGDKAESANADSPMAAAPSDPSPSPPETESSAAATLYTSFSDDRAMIQHIMSELREANPGMPVKVGQLTEKLGRKAVWETFLEALHTSLPAKGGKTRSPGSTFLLLLKQKEQAAKLT